MILPLSFIAFGYAILLYLFIRFEEKSDDSDWMQINSGLVAIGTNSEVKHNKKLIIKSQKITKQLVAIYNTI